MRGLSTLSYQSLCPVALTHIPMECFEKLVLQHMKDNIPASLDAHQEAFRTEKYSEDAISTALHSVFAHLGNKNKLHQKEVC